MPVDPHQSPRVFLDSKGVRFGNATFFIAESRLGLDFPLGTIS
ncbi:hypothetical protein [Thalassoroseus pseudoceratinae]|nr:hypothetical protein [Thalassoroseus pseudoceratinae]